MYLTLETLGQCKSNVYRGGELGLTQGFVISFHVNSIGRWAILLLLISQASNKMLGELPKTNVQNLYVRPSAPSVHCFLRDTLSVLAAGQQAAGLVYQWNSNNC